MWESAPGLATTASNPSGPAHQPPDQLALVVGLTPLELVPEPGAAFGHLVHDLLERLRPVPFGLAASERPSLGPNRNSARILSPPSPARPSRLT